MEPKVLEVLKSVFGFEGFRGVQEAAVKAALQGGGKSLCYALPAVVSGGLVLVVSPLIGVCADYLSSTRSAAERKHILDQLTPAAAATALEAPDVSSQLSLLYVTPELLATDRFRQQLETLHTQCSSYIKLIAVDEAHCISQWGHDYRSTYRQLFKLRGKLKGVPCMALTATATPQVRQDIISSLRLSNPVILTSSFNRPNIHYSVLLLDIQQAQSLHNPEPRAAVEAAAAVGTDSDDEVSEAGGVSYACLLELLKPGSTEQQRCGSSQPGPIAIVYALKRSTVDLLSMRLSSEGIAVAGYHAALPAAKREDVLQQWRAGLLQVVVATVAFGMGVDKGDIELVVHYNLPKSLEAFYQESGRAGRNGQPARSVLMYSTRDRRLMDWILQKEASRRRRKQAAVTARQKASSSATTNVDDSSDPTAAAAALRAFGAVVELCTTAACRRRRLLQHFGEVPQAQQQQQDQQQRCCDFCDSAADVEAAVEQLQRAGELMLQRRFSKNTGVGRKRHHTGVDEWGNTGSSLSDEGLSSPLSSGDEGAQGDSKHVAEALAAAKRQAVVGSGKAGRTSRPSSEVVPDAFLTAMMKAEQAQQRSARAGKAGNGDQLEQLLAKRRQTSNVDTTLSKELRDSRRSKLAEVICSNSSLQQCSKEVAVELATAYEASIAAACDGDAVAHRTQLLQLVGVIRSTPHWLDLPRLHLLSGSALEMALQHGVAQVLAEARQCAKQWQQQQPSSTLQNGCAACEEAEARLKQLSHLKVTADALEATNVAAAVKGLRKHGHPGIAAAASLVITAWRETIATSC